MTNGMEERLALRCVVLWYVGVEMTRWMRGDTGPGGSCLSAVGPQPQVYLLAVTLPQIPGPWGDGVHYSAVAMEVRLCVL